jgi:PIN like domain
LSDEQPKTIVFFLDRNHGDVIRVRLKQFGFEVKACNRIYAPEIADTEWIAECAKENWVILSGDKSIEEVPWERQAVIDGKCKVFMFDDSNSASEEWLAAILVGRRRIVHLIENADGPFFITIRKFGHSHISPPRFIPGTGSGWKPPSEHAPISAPTTEKRRAKRVLKPRQPSLWDQNNVGASKV